MTEQDAKKRTEEIDRIIREKNTLIANTEYEIELLKDEQQKIAKHLSLDERVKRLFH